MAKKKSNTKGKGAESTVAKKTSRAVSPPNEYLFLFACLFITLVCYIPALTNGWTNWDDQGYVYENPMTMGLSFSTLSHFFTTYQMGNYHPLPMLSLAIDYKLFPGEINAAALNGEGIATGFHVHSVLLHLINVTLVFFFARLLSKKIWVATITALFFGIHPAHIESVSWISERKDLLYVLYYMAALITYLKYIKTDRKVFFYGLTIVLFILSLMSKGQAVTFSVVLVLIDYYLRSPFTIKTILEKVPFFVLSLVFGVIAILAQKSAKAITDIPYYDLKDKLIFSNDALFTYFYKSLFPFKLSAFYPYPLVVDGHYLWVVKLSPAFVAIMLGLAIFAAVKGWRIIIFGFSFFFVNVILLLQILAVGGAMMADRYTYVAYVGLFFMMAMGVQWVIDNSTTLAKNLRVPVILLTIAFTGFFSVTTFARNHIWKNSESLYLDMLTKYWYIPVPNNNLGNYYQKHNRNDLALKYFTDAIKLQSDYKEARINRSDIYRQRGQIDSAIEDCSRVIAIDKDYSGAYMNRGIAYSIKGRYDSAMHDFSSVLRLEPKSARAYGNLGNLNDMKGKYDTAIYDYNMALKLDPTYTDVYGNRGRSLMKQGKYDESLKDLNKAIEIDPDNGDNYTLRSDAYNGKGDFQNALNDALTAQSKGKQVDAAYIEQLKTKTQSK